MISTTVALVVLFAVFLVLWGAGIAAILLWFLFK